MTTLIGLHQLTSANEVTVQCCQKSFSVSTPQDGQILYAKNKWLKILDVEKNPVIRTSNSWRWYPTMLEVTVWDHPPNSLLKPLYVKQEGRCLLVNERDTKQVVAKVICQGEFEFNSMYEIWSTNGFGDHIAEIGRMTLDDNEFNIRFPDSGVASQKQQLNETVTRKIVQQQYQNN